MSPAVGSRWFREGGGLSTVDPRPLSKRYLPFAEREATALVRAQQVGVREITRWLGPRALDDLAEAASQRHHPQRPAELSRAATAQWHADRRARRPKVARLAANEQLPPFMQDRLASGLTHSDGRAVPGPAVASRKRRHDQRVDRRWATAWSPEQIANRLPVDPPDDESMRISHDAI